MPVECAVMGIRESQERQTHVQKLTVLYLTEKKGKMFEK